MADIWPTHLYVVLPQKGCPQNCLRMSMYAVAFQFPFNGTKSPRPVPEKPWRWYMKTYFDKVGVEYLHRTLTLTPQNTSRTNWNTNWTQTLLAQHPCTQHLNKALVAVWARNPMVKFQNLLESLPQRVDAFIEAHELGMGGSTSKFHDPSDIS